MTTHNTDQIAYWNDAAGQKWVARQEQLDRQNAPFSDALLERLAVAPGERAIDVGCGTGATTLELARRVGPKGRVLGLDVSRPMLALARERSRSVANVEYVMADAQTYELTPASYDLWFSRFGVMFFDDTAAAFANLRRALTKNGRIGFVCFQPLERNTWMDVAARAARAHVEVPAPVPGGPGPFGLADRAATQGILERAGYRQVEIIDHQLTVTVGGTPDLDAAAEFTIQFGPTGTAVRGAPVALVDKVRGAVREALAPFHTAEGVRMTGAVWLVLARA